MMPRPGVARAVLALLALMTGLLVLVGGPALNLSVSDVHVVRVQGYSYDTASQDASGRATSQAAGQRPASLSAGRRVVGDAGPSVSTGAGVAAEAGGTGLRAARQAYVDGARAIADDGAAQIAAGADASTVARGAVDARNALKAAAPDESPEAS